MTLYNWLTVLGIPSLVAAVIGFLIKQIKKDIEVNDKKTEAVQLGIQSILMDRLDFLHDAYVKQGWVDVHKKRLFENMYKQYLALGLDGVMKQSWEDVQKLPTQPPETKPKGDEEYHGK